MWLRLKALARGERLNREVDDEIAFHLAMRAEKNRQAGLDTREARYAARRQFGNISQVKESSRTLWAFAALDGLWRDCTYAVRTLIKQPTLTLVVIVTLALGIGANTAIFSIVNGLILRPLPIANPQEVVYLAFPNGPGIFDATFSYAEFTQIRQQTRDIFHDQAAMIYGGLAGFANGADGLTVDEKTEAVQTAFVTGNFFSLLGLPPYQGRLLLPSEGNAAGADPVVVLGYRYWKTRFSADPHIVGKKGKINGQPVTIVGIAPKDFDGITPIVAMQAYLPLGMATVDSGGTTSFISDPKMRTFIVVARMKSTMSLDKVRSILNVIGQRLFQQYPRTAESSALCALALRPPGGLSQPDVFPRVANLFLLLAALVLLLACINVANLLFVRGNARQREMAVRTALGASKARLIRQLLTESTLLAVLGGIAGLLLGLNTRRVLSALPLESELPIRLDFPFDWRVFAYASAIALSTGVLVGLFPALRMRFYSLREMLLGVGRSSTAVRQRLRSILVAVQVGGSLTLLIVAGLFLRSLQSAQRADLGFDPRNVLNLNIDPREIGYTQQQGVAFYQELLRRVRAAPGVGSASTASTVPMGETVSGDDLIIPGFPPGPNQAPPHAIYTAVSSGNFKTMSVPQLRGRDFQDSDDAHAPRVAIINEAMAARFWSNQDPIGKKFRRSGDHENQIEIVGVVKNTRLEALYGPFQEAFYLPFEQAYTSSQILQVRAAANPEAKSRELVGIIQSIAPTMPVYGVRTMTRALHNLNGLLLFQLGAALAGALGALGLALAVVGIYGVTCYSVSRRTAEIGIRMALGAEPGQVLRTIGRQGFILIAAGLAGGWLAAFAIGSLLGDFLVGVSPRDPATYVVVSLLLAAIALLASYVPARRATLIDPMAALRYE
jgi:predicted permease